MELSEIHVIVDIFQHRFFHSTGAIMSNYNSSKNPFEDNPFEDDTEPEKSSRVDDLKQIQSRIYEVEDQSLQSTRRALRTLYDTHDVGVKTAEELVRQGEKLQGVEDRLDEANQKLDDTQKTLNKIKSVFGGFKNMMHFKDKPKKGKDKSMPASKSMGNIGTSSRAAAKPDYPVITGSDKEKEINRNLTEMSRGLTGLTSLALDMQRELDRQNPTIERLNYKVPSVQDKIEDQNTQMKRILM